VLEDHVRRVHELDAFRLQVRVGGVDVRDPEVEHVLLAGLVTVLVVYRLGRELWNPTTGRYAAAVAATTQGLFVHSRVPMPDMMLTAFGALSLWALHRMRRRPTGLAWLAFYVALAAGFWTKGPAGLMPLGVALGYAVFRRRVEPIGWLRLGPGLLVLAGLVAPWTLAAALREGDAVQRTVAVDYVLWYMPQHLSIVTLLTPIEHLLSVMVPWVWLAPFAVVDAWRLRHGKGAEREAVVLVLVWTAALVALLSLSQQQRVRYYVPLVPPISLLLGWWLGTAVVQRRTPSLWPFRWTAALLGTGAAVAVVWSAAQGRLLRDAWAILPTSSWQMVLVTIAGATVVVVMELGLRTQRVGRAVPVAVVAAAVFLAAMNHAVQLQRNAGADFPAMVRLAAQARAAEQGIVTAGIPALPVAFYLGQPVTELTPEALARGGWAEAGTVVMLADSAVSVEHAGAITVMGRASIGRQQVAIGRVTGPLAPLPVAAAVSAPASASTARNRVRHVAFEVLCVVIALAAVVGRTHALRHGTAPAVYAAEASIILAIASFPAHAWVFVAGLAAAVSYAFLRWRRLALPDSPHVWMAGLLILALPLDVLEDVLWGHPVRLDPVWLISALLGVAVLTWSRVRPATA
jgi:4-amino-4-deoxy-L-arabinose transferase-like glycosyltransferase